MTALLVAASFGNQDVVDVLKNYSHQDSVTTATRSHCAQIDFFLSVSCLCFTSLPSKMSPISKVGSFLVSHVVFFGCHPTFSKKSKRSFGNFELKLEGELIMSMKPNIHKRHDTATRFFYDSAAELKHTHLIATATPFSCGQ
jgi:hypothetical protein